MTVVTDQLGILQRLWANAGPVRVSDEEFGRALQIAADDGRLVGVPLGDVAHVVREPASRMPAFGAERLTDAALEDLLAVLAASAGAAP